MYNVNMKREEIIALIRENNEQLTKLGVSSLAVFGSVARDEASKTSDVDILVEFNGKATFDRFMDTKFFLEDLLGLQVDLVRSGHATGHQTTPETLHHAGFGLCHVTRGR